MHNLLKFQTGKNTKEITNIQTAALPAKRAKTMNTTNYKQRSIEVYKKMVNNGQLKEAGRLLRALNNGVGYLTISYSDTDWSLSEAFGLLGNKSIRIR